MGGAQSLKGLRPCRLSFKNGDSGKPGQRGPLLTQLQGGKLRRKGLPGWSPVPPFCLSPLPPLLHATSTPHQSAPHLGLPRELHGVPRPFYTDEIGAQMGLLESQAVWGHSTAGHTHTHTHGLKHSGRLKPRGPVLAGAPRALTHPPCGMMGASVESGDGRSWELEGLL